MVAKGVIPTLRRPGGGRSQIDTEAILDLLAEVTTLRKQGGTSGVVETAIDRLRERGRLHRKLRPNTSPAELRRIYRTTTPVQGLARAADEGARGRDRRDQRLDPGGEPGRPDHAQASDGPDQDLIDVETLRIAEERDE